jgi:uncharacterized membrane protein YsdA (DUF1294 family)
MKKSKLLELALAKVISNEAANTCEAIAYVVDEDFGNNETEKNGSELREWIMGLLEGYGSLGFWLAKNGFKDKLYANNFTVSFWKKVRENSDRVDQVDDSTLERERGRR